MTHQWELTDAERELVLDLLENERAELPAEIRRTKSQSVRDRLRDRLAMVEELIHRLRFAPVES